MDVEITVDVMEMASHVDHAVLISGDGDFRRLVEAVQRKGTRVVVVSTIRTSPPMIADELRRQADSFVDLAELQPFIARDHSGPRYDEAARSVREPTAAVDDDDAEYDDAV